ncbi:MAG: hypothetical protein PWP08_1258 [Methanofollis sp.]|nr:hypothetical protein [Methanofollis sp.]
MNAPDLPIPNNAVALPASASAAFGSFGEDQVVACRSILVFFQRRKRFSLCHEEIAVVRHDREGKIGKDDRGVILAHRDQGAGGGAGVGYRGIDITRIFLGFAGDIGPGTQ